MLLFLLILLPVCIIGAALYTYYVAFYTNRKHHSLPDVPMTGREYEEVSDNLHRIGHIMAKQTFEPVWIWSRDGLRLYGRYYHHRDGAPTMLLMHGYKSHPFRDCAGGHALARKMGFNILVPDQRCHGESQGNTITFGIRERLDCADWVSYLTGRFGTDFPIILCGLSMGAATVLMASELDLPEQVCCVIADCPYDSPAGIIEKVCGDKGYPVTLCRPLIRLGARLFGRLDLYESDACRAVANTHLPVLVLHGEADRYVPCDMSRKIAGSGANVVLHTFPDAGHGLCYMTDPIRYELAVYAFLDAVPALQGRIPKDFIKQRYL